MSDARELASSVVDDNNEKASSCVIRPIDKTTVHKICSGQVVVTLAVAVKELIENSLDAGSTCIEIRLKNYGGECIEVIDNGSGIEAKNFQALALKHHTSKLTDFLDIFSINTFGFRGEALSSLCALCDLTVLTCHKNAANGSKLEYDHNNKLVSEVVYPMQIGTTVILKNVFSTLPVRHKEFTKNLKKEFNKMVQVLYGYGLVSRGTRFLCTNQVGDGKKTTIFSTHGKSNIRDNICSIFGAKQLVSLTEFKQCVPTPELAEEYKLVLNSADENFFTVSGFVSSCKHGSGRNAADRQFFYINGRPCEANKLAKVVNEVYRTFNRHQNPFVVLDVGLRQDAVDVNVTPDKRQIIFENEKLLFCTIKSSLLKMYEATPCTLDVHPLIFPVTSSAPIGNKSIESYGTRTHSAILAKDSIREKKSFLKRSFAFSSDSTPTRRNSDGKPLNKQMKLAEFTNTARCHRKIFPSSVDDDDDEARAIALDEPSADESALSSLPRVDLPDACDGVDDATSEVESERDFASLGNAFKTTKRKEMRVSFEFDKRKTMTKRSVIPSPATRVADDDASRVDTSTTTDRESDEPNVQEPIIHLMDVNVPTRRKEVEVPFDLKRLKFNNESRKTDSTYCRRYKAKISPQENTVAEEELKKQLSKEMFSQMDIIGQFNLGFVIAKLGSDLFIIDQHATDEKYNFEMLQNTTVLQNQKLVRPMNLELTPLNESVLIDNLDVFQKNGFDFNIDDSETTCRKVKLTSVPASKNWIFGKDDVDELIFMLSDSPGTFCRPSRVQKMFASRACRSSVMIGTSLTVSEMKKLVQHMGTIEQPWNCPHGRPTIRHLIDLKLLA